MGLQKDFVDFFLGFFLGIAKIEPLNNVAQWTENSRPAQWAPITDEKTDISTARAPLQPQGTPRPLQQLKLSLHLQGNLLQQEGSTLQ